MVRSKYRLKTADGRFLRRSPCPTTPHAVAVSRARWCCMGCTFCHHRHHGTHPPSHDRQILDQIYTVERDLKIAAGVVQGNRRILTNLVFMQG